MTMWTLCAHVDSENPTQGFPFHFSGETLLKSSCREMSLDFGNRKFLSYIFSPYD